MLESRLARSVENGMPQPLRLGNGRRRRPDDRPAALPASFGSFGAIIALNNSAELLVQGGIFNGNNLAGAAFGGGFMQAFAQSKLTLSGVTVRSRAETVIAANGSVAMVLNNQTLIDNVGAASCPTGAAIVVTGASSVTLDHAQISNAAGGGICVCNSVATSTISLIQSTITKSASAIASEVGQTSSAVVTLDGASLTNNPNSGIRWDGAAGTSFDIKNSTLTGNAIGLQLNATSGSFKLRNSNVSNNTLWAFGSIAADLGTQADPGANTFTGNTNVELKDNLAAGTVQAVGNTWNAGQQGADANGHYSTAQTGYTPVPKLGPTSGKNFSISFAVTLDL